MTEQEKVVVRALREAAKQALAEWQNYTLSGYKDRAHFAENEPVQHLRMCRIEAVLDTSVIVMPDVIVVPEGVL